MKEGAEYGKLSEEPGLPVILFIKIPSSSNVYLSLRGRKNPRSVMVTGLIIHTLFGIQSKDSINQC